MLDRIKELLSNWKVTVALVGGALVVGSTLGTCTVEPSVQVVEDEVDEALESVGEESSTEEAATTGEAATAEGAATAEETKTE